MEIQEVEITLTLNVVASKSKEEIKSFIEDLINEQALRSSSKNRWEYPLLEVKSIREEAEIYGDMTPELIRELTHALKLLKVVTSEATKPAIARIEKLLQQIKED